MSTLLQFYYNTQFQRLSSKIFAKDCVDTLIYHVHHQVTANHSRVTTHLISAINDLRITLEQTKLEPLESIVIFIPQPYSWGRLCLTRTAFQIILDNLNVFPQFLEIVAAFGVKSSEDERVVKGWRSCMGSKKCLQKQHELCYNILYVEEHGRKLNDPWSLRQAGVYHQQRENPNGSWWILLNVPEHIRSRLKDTFNCNFDCCHLSLHAELLFATGVNWGVYVDYLASELMNHDNIASYSRVDDQANDSYCISFDDLQKLYSLQNKMRRAEEAVGSSFDIAQGCKKHAKTHSNSKRTEGCRSRCDEILDLYAAEMTRHRLRIKTLSRRLQNTLDFLSKTLMFRNEELWQISNRASTKTLEMLLNITGQGKYQQQTLTDLFRTGQADSAMLKALSIVATVCLPASLIATIFSSNLIQTISSHLTLAPQFWIYVAIAIPLMLLTLFWILYLDRASRKHIRAGPSGAQA